MDEQTVKPLLILVAMATLVAACRSSSSTTPTTATAAVPSPGSGPMVRTSVRIGETFIPQRGDAAVQAFVPDVAAEETGGECQLVRTGGSGATFVTAYYPTRAAPQLQVSVTFDSAGRLVRYSERRGVPHFPTTGMSLATLDSITKETEAKMRSTTISLDYAIDQGIASNRGGGKPTVAVLGTVRAVESLDRLGPPRARQERMRKLCGV